MTDLGEVQSPLLRLENVRRYFPIGNWLPWSRHRAQLRALDGISLDVKRQETVSLVGESGCGKTTTARLTLLLDQPTGGRILWRGTDMRTATRDQLREYRASVQPVFQDPWSSLSPRMRVRDIIAEPYRINQRGRRTEAYEKVAELLEAVGLDPSLSSNYPHEFSGGMRQRIAVARALILRPSLLVLDEPVSALDVSIRAQIMNLLKDLQERFGTAYLLIAHNMATVRYLSQRVVVMYLGEIVEHAASEKLFENPLHPYTIALQSASLPVRPGQADQEVILSGEVPSPINPPSGCPFHPRCPLWVELGRPERCRAEKPTLREVAPERSSACHYAEELLSVRTTPPDRSSPTPPA